MKKTRILIVDDEALILLIWEDALRSEGYEVMTALNGAEAMDIIHAHKQDIVITDLVMPGMSGIELCRKIKKISPETQVVLLSGYLEEATVKNAFIAAGGRDLVLQKPVPIESLIEVVGKITNEERRT